MQIHVQKRQVKVNLTSENNPRHPVPSLAMAEPLHHVQLDAQRHPLSSFPSTPLFLNILSPFPPKTVLLFLLLYSLQLAGHRITIKRVN